VSEGEGFGAPRIRGFVYFGPNSDVYAVRVDKVVSVTPLSLDLTSRINLQDLEKLLRG